MTMTCPRSLAEHSGKVLVDGLTNTLAGNYL